MSALQKLKAYFGMVPADEVDRYGAEDDDRYRRGYADDYGQEDYEPYAAAGSRDPARIDTERFGRRRRFGRYQPELVEDTEDYEPDPEPTRGRRNWATDAPVRGALAVDPQREPAPRPRAVPEHPAHALSRITTLQPRNYAEARTIGEHYREGTPVIINLTELNDADARRLVDFAAGLAFALRGAIDKITNKVFLLSPPNIDVTAEDRRRLAEGGFLNQG